MENSKTARVVNKVLEQDVARRRGRRQSHCLVICDRAGEAPFPLSSPILSYPLLYGLLLSLKSGCRRLSNILAAHYGITIRTRSG